MECAGVVGDVGLDLLDLGGGDGLGLQQHRAQRTQMGPVAGIQRGDLTQAVFDTRSKLGRDE